jgi:hypothetical protein
LIIIFSHYVGHPFYSTSGISNARSLATLAALVGNGGQFKSHKFFNSSAISKANTCLSEQVIDKILLIPLVNCNGGWSKFGPVITKHKNLFGWGGAGGSMIVFDPTKKIAASYVPQARLGKKILFIKI